jgi:molecular chaperone DnaJ
MATASRDYYEILGVARDAEPGAVLRLRGKGLPEFGSGKYGDLFLRMQAHVPEKLSDEERKLYEQLRALKQKPKQKRQTAT